MGDSMATKKPIRKKSTPVKKQTASKPRKKAPAKAAKKKPGKKVATKKKSPVRKSPKSRLKIGSLVPRGTEAPVSGRTPLVVPISRALLSKNPRTLAENYDEFQHDREVTEIIKANPLSILRVDMAHCNPDSGLDDGESPETISRAKKELELIRPNFKEVKDFVYVYRITVKDRPGMVQIGLGAHVSTRAIQDPVENPKGSIIRNEAIFPHKAEGRSRLIKGLGAIIGTVNLCVPDQDRRLQKTLEALIRSKPADIGGPDRKGDLHEVWMVSDPAVVRDLLALYQGREFYVADGNHRSKAAQMLGLPHFLAVIFCGETMNIDPYHRLIADLPFAPEVFLREVEKAGFRITPVSKPGPFHATHTHEMGLYIGGKWYTLVPEKLAGLDARASIDAQIIEDRIVKGLLGRDPGDKRIAYVGGDYNPAYLQKQVDEGHFQAALSMPPMTMPEFYRINESRQMLPRKTTWFTPKIRSGLVISLL